MKRLRLLAALALAALCGIAEASAKVGLSSQFIDVVFEGLKPGRSYNIRRMKGVPYTVKNRGDAVADVMVEAVVPRADRVIAPYKPIPDPTWIKFSPDRIRIDPKSLGFSDIIIDVPDDPSIIGKHYQAMIWAHTVDKGLLAVGVKSRVRFSIGPGPESIDRERRRKAMVTLNYDLWPNSLNVRKAVAGKRYDVKRKEKKSFKITNRNDEPLEVVLSAIPWPHTTVRLPTGYTHVKDLSWVKFRPATVKVKGSRVKEIKMIFDKVPEELKNQKIAFLIQIALPIGTPISATHRVFVTIAEDGKK